MADLSFYKYLEAAFRHKLFKDKTATRFNYLSYNLTYERIFYYARKILPSFYRNEAQFPNTEEGNLQLAKTVLEKLDNHRDVELENQFKGTATHEENQIIEQAAAESQQTGIPQEQAVSAGATAGGGMPGMPSAPIIHNVPQIKLPGKLPEDSVGPATAKIDRLNAEKNKLPEAFQKAFESETASRRFNFSAARSSTSSAIGKMQNFA